MADRSTILSLRQVAAVAEKLADDYEKGRLWEGEFSQALGEIRRALNSISGNTR